MRNHRLERTMWALVACLPLAAAAATDAPPQTGVWQKHEYSLSYAGFTTYYSCDGIADKVKLLLLAAGARADAKVVGSCSDAFDGPSRIATARATFYTLVPEPGAAAPAAAAEHVAGVWRPVEFRDGTPDGLQDGDCELVAQFDRELLPMFTTRNHESHMTCVPHQRVLGSINVRFETFTVPPKAKAARPPTPQ